jgi:hypothetical protein
MAMNNRAPIAEHMRTLIAPDSAAAHGLALEIGSGTGAQLQVLAEAYPGLIWRPSEHVALHPHASVPCTTSVPLCHT